LLNYECGWKGGDRGGLAERKNEKNYGKSKKTLDRDWPSHGRTLPSQRASMLFPDVVKWVIFLYFSVVSLGTDFEEDMVG